MEEDAVKKSFAILIGFVLTLALVAGCSTVPTETPSSDNGSESVSDVEVIAEPETAEPELVHPEGPTTLSDKEIEEIKVLLTEGEFGYTESEFGWGYFMLFSEDELAELEVGLPIYVYPLRSDEPGSYRFFGVAPIYPVYRNGRIDGVVISPGVEGLYATPDGDTRYNELMALLDEGDCGSIAILTADDGTYFYDGTGLVRLNDMTDNLAHGMGNVDTGFTSLESADLPNELLSQIMLTDTSVRTPLG